MILVGDENVGKSMILNHMTGLPFREIYNPTNSWRNARIRNPEFSLEVCDFSGRTSFRSTSLKSRFERAHIAIICFDLTNGASFNRIESWICYIKKFYSDCVMFLVGTKADLKRVIPTTKGQRLAEIQNAQYIETSFKFGVNTEEFMSEIKKSA